MGSEQPNSGSGRWELSSVTTRLDLLVACMLCLSVADVPPHGVNRSHAAHRRVRAPVALYRLLLRACRDMAKHNIGGTPWIPDS